jgi:hypothetical protein
MNSSKIRVSPELAREWLDKYNTSNRPIVKQNVKSIANDIAAGLWREDHPHAIVFDTNGRLIDGQHRLLAIVEAKTPVVMNIIRGASPDLRDFIDTGKSRKMSDRVAINENGRINASIIAMAKYFTAGSSSGTRDLISVRATAIANADGLVWAAHWRDRNVRCITVTPIAAALAKLYVVNKDVATACAASLLLPDGDVQPMRVLRDFALRNGSRTGGSMAMEMHARAFSAMKAALEGRNIGALRASQDTSIDQLRAPQIAAVA